MYKKMHRFALACGKCATFGTNGPFTSSARNIE